MDRFYGWLVQLLPRRLVYFCYIRLHAEATTNKYVDRTPYEVDWREAVGAWHENPIRTVTVN